MQQITLNLSVWTPYSAKSMIRHSVLLLAVFIWSVFGLEKDENVANVMRAIAVGHRQNVSNSISYETFQGQFVSRSDLYKARWDGYAQNDAVMVFGELTGLTAAFIGTRGASARSQTSIVVAMEMLMKSYSKQIKRYKQKYPEISSSSALGLSLSDVMYRSMTTTFSRIAYEFQTYVVVGTLLPNVYESRDPADIEFFGDPDIKNQESVYLPVSPEVYNMALLFGPDGKLVGNVSKTHLCAAEVAILGMTPSPVERNLVFNTSSIGSMCIAICFDGFHDDVVRSLDSQGCRVMLHPSYNDVTWPRYNTGDNSSSIWQPTDWASGPIGMLQTSKTSNINIWINAMVTGNLMDLVVDGQSSITQKSDNKIGQESCYVGVTPDELTISPYSNLTGTVLAMAPWAYRDPVEIEDLSQRRAELIALADTLKYGSGSDMEGLYGDNVVYADVIFAG